jgi:hypothetical protein
MFPEKDPQYATTWNFIFRGSDGGTYSFAEGFAFSTMPTASAHVYLDPQAEERTWAPGKGPGVADDSGAVVARAVWFITDGATVSFALLRVNPGRNWSADVCTLGMPHGIDRTIDVLPSLVPISIYGQGFHPATNLTGRKGGPEQDYLLYGRNDDTQVNKASSTEVGDSGAPALSGDNQALGIVHHASDGEIYRLGPLINKAEARLHITLNLERQPGGTAR